MPKCRKGHDYDEHTRLDPRGRRICAICLNDGRLCQHCRLRPPARKGHPYCSKACSNSARALPLAERFLLYFHPGQPGQCWPWTGTIDKHGYGLISGERREQLRAHRLAYERVNGPVPSGQNVLHRCDNPPCCNPAHLFAGTVADNNQDKVSKGRQPHGVTHPLAKLSENDVRTIRGLYPQMTQTAIAKQYGLDQTTVSDIVRRKIWRHI